VEGTPGVDIDLELARSRRGHGYQEASLKRFISYGHNDIILRE